jgi:4-amino-4-deoxy-L-arabinose transferase-like glycosyltransferase
MPEGENRHSRCACEYGEGLVRISIDTVASAMRRRYTVAAVCILAVAAFNLFYRLDREIVTEWDESLYAISAAETAANGRWIGITFDGALDYYNTKPPLNVWLIAASFKAFGVNLVSLRVVSAAAAWLTILALMLWARRAVGPATALLAGLVLCTTHGFIYVHSGRSANTDALFTLFVLLTAIALWAAHRRPWALAWLGPIVAAVFLLRGMAVLMPLAMIVTVMVLGGRPLRERWAPLSVAAMISAAPVAAWTVARYRVDQWEFLGRMFHYDFVARTASALEGHTGSLLYYPNVLQKDQYEWLAVAVLTLLLFPRSWRRLRDLSPDTDTNRYLRVLAGSWLGLTLVLPTLMQTKVAWYLNPFFPLFALMIGCLVSAGFAQTDVPSLARRRRLAAGFVALAFAVAEGKLIYYSHARRDLRNTVQGLLLAERQQIAGHRVFKDSWWNRADRFVLEHIVGGEPREVEDMNRFVRRARRGDFFVSPPNGDHPGVITVRANARHRLCRRGD